MTPDAAAPLGPVTVEVPATSANLGPGYDCLGLALELTDTLVGEVVPGGGLVVEVEGEAATEVPLDESHLVVRAMRALFEEAGVAPPGLRLRCTNRIPHSRGLGSSSAAIVGGLVLARALLPAGTDTDALDLLALADALEGHPDNVAPALLGGLVVSGHDAAGVWASRHPVTGRAVVLVPPYAVSTALARGLLPDQVSHADAAANTARAALLVATLLGGGDARALLTATEDLLHQQYRRPAMPESLDLVESLRADGFAAVVSGAGPTVLAFVVDDGPGGGTGGGPGGGPGSGAAAAEQRLLDAAPSGWSALAQAVGGPGARVLA